MLNPSAFWSHHCMILQGFGVWVASKQSLIHQNAAQVTFKSLTYRPSRLVVVQVHGTSQISFSFRRVDELSRELVCELDVVAASSPLPVVRRPQWRHLTETSRLSVFVLLMLLLLLLVVMRCGVGHGRRLLLKLLGRSTRTRVYRAGTARPGNTVR